MNSLRMRFLSTFDRSFGWMVAVLVLAAILGFGGTAWWSRPALVAAATALTLMLLVRNLVEGRVTILKSPLGLLGLAALALGVLQVLPLPAGLAGRLSPTARAVYARGALPDLARADDPGATLAEAATIRSPASLDRAATVRRLALAAACLGVFWCASHAVDRLQRLYLIWGAVIAGFLLNTTFALVQISTRTDGLYGYCIPGAGAPWWAPDSNDLLDAPAVAALRELPAATAPGSAPSAQLEVVRPFTFGSLPGGVGGFLALGALALPLILALVIHLCSPRGSRESWADRMAGTGRGSLAILLTLLSIPGAFLVGMAAGPWFCVPAALGLAMVGLPALFTPGARVVGLGLSSTLLVALASGVAAQARWDDMTGARPPLEAPDWRGSREVWRDASHIFREFPVVGVGLGAFGAVQPYFKDRDLASNTAMSSLLQWSTEAGLVGLAILGVGALWCLARIPGSLKRLGSMDRFLAHGLIGAALALSLLAAVHWTVELTAVAVSASALGGTWNRWLAGGTDLFVERG
ncbi:O-antigen ligase family protein [Paludisphaera mucosa]|uniref:O-antigen ligase family protein n=1 Tax=Paludisphaera mucosa TaxID=3030827 RepID=A0ABT6FJB5_9BACT|nr:O-antigen ligase family protein [Paludisphaera mucosa]MDG3007589.1 O-antigen ligase family protein [Paludisphaera mucosa]